MTTTAVNERSLLALLLLVAAMASVLPLLRSAVWLVRGLDVVRLQVAAATVGLILLALALRAWRGLAGGLGLLVGLAALGVHAARLLPYQPLAEPMAPAVRDCLSGVRLRVMVANVQKSNETAEHFLDRIAQADPDVLLVLETGARWDEALQGLDGYPHRVRHIPEDAVAYGIHLLSRLPLEEPRVELWFDAVTPTVLADVALPGGGTARLIGLHPRPPLPPDQSSTRRDAHILRAALEARGAAAPVILAGDLNAVPWEPVVGRALRVGGLLDPRAGRGLSPTYGAESWWKAWPLDHVLFGEGAGLLGWEVLPAFGSDHRPVLADLCLDPALAARQEAPEAGPDEVAAAERSIRAAELMDPRR